MTLRTQTVKSHTHTQIKVMESVGKEKGREKIFKKNKNPTPTPQNKQKTKQKTVHLSPEYVIDVSDQLQKLISND